MTVLVAVLTLAGALLPAPARPSPGPFPEVPLPAPRRERHLLAYGVLAGGAGLIGASFVFGGRANDAYDAYQVETEPDRIERLYDRTVLNDRLAGATLLLGEALVAAGLYLRFLRTPPAAARAAAGAGGGPTLALEPLPPRCALVVRF